MKDKKRGFSIIELLVVLGVIAMFSMVSLPYFVSYQKNIKLKNEVKLLATNLKYAQQLAVTEQIIYQVILAPETKSYQIINSESAEVIKTVNLDDEVDFYNFTTSTFSFNATGAVLEYGQIVLINTKNSTVTIEIKPSGYVQLIES